MIRDDIKAALVSAMKGGDKARTGTLRLIQSAIKNRDIELRGSDQAPEDDAAGHRSAAEDGQAAPRIDRRSTRRAAARTRRREAAEIAVIERFLPAQMSDDETKAAIDAIIAETGAASVKDMGRVMAA